MITKKYTFPVEGKMKNWETFSGDPNNPVRPHGLKEVLRSLPEDSSYSAKVDTYYMDDGVVTVDISTDEEGHKVIEIEMNKKRGELFKRLKRNRSDPEIKVSTSMNRITKMRG